MATLRLTVSTERFPLRVPFVISRGMKTEAEVVVATLTDGIHTGRGECVPYARYGETVDAVVRALEAAGPLSDRATVQATLPPGAARNALDCAVWDLEAKRSTTSAPNLAGLPALSPCITCYTLSLGTPAEMAAAAAAVPRLPLLKLKLGGGGDAERMQAVRAARPDARLVADANEAWTPDQLAPFMAAAASARFELVEQPLPAGADGPLADIPHLVPVCADESAHTAADIPGLRPRYDAVNVKLDKSGGLTAALEVTRSARREGLGVMVGCMVASSLAMAPAMLLAQDADWVDLDGPLLLARDRTPPLTIVDGMIQPPDPRLWG